MQSMDQHRQVQGHRRRGGGPRVAAPAARREWVPRGSSAVSTTNQTEGTHQENDVDSSCRGDTQNERSRGRYFNSGRIHGVAHRGNYSARSNAGRPMNQKREKEIEKRSAGDVEKIAKEKDPNLPQLAQEIEEKLIKGSVECMICYDMVRRSAPVWSCSSCYSIFHLSCIKKWARAPTSIDLSAEKSQGVNWRCPGCQHVQLTSSKEIHYTCFCGKRTDPPSDLYLTPHSCGEPCGKPLERGAAGDEACPHVCVLQCHPGPCPPCKAFAPPQWCPCGKEMITTRCADRKFVLTCGRVCNKLLECGRHRCERLCHVGPCDPCQALFNASCFCSRSADVLLCGDMAIKGEFDTEKGVFSCSTICGKQLACGNHYCNEICHPGSCGECILLPEKIKTCHCGKTSLSEERRSCFDPISTCTQVCGKMLRCRLHFCKEKCHVGDCPPCSLPVNQKCRCGLTSRNIECCKTKDDIFTCDKPCGRKKNCGRHRCSERCCPLSKLNSVPPDGWDPHFCSMSCDKKLRCGQHLCVSLCHSGHCPPCLEMIFSDLTCACGRTSIPPPLPCGTPPPSCQLPCSVPQPCRHSASHSCHFGDCPPCSVPVAKECVGGHVVLRNIPCGSKDIRCNKPCGKTRRCGLHACGRTCHPPPCDADSSSEHGFKVSCGQICGAPRRDCRHTCKAPCHPSAPCPDTRCEFPVTITCSCGRITATVPCDVGGANGNFSSDTLFEASIIQKLPAPVQPVESTIRVPLGQRKLMCNDECAKVERKRVLAEAFDITPPNLEALHFGENLTISESVMDLFRRDPKWVLSIEERCKFLVLGKSRGSASSLKVHVFCPMLKEKRDAVRLIAERWKLAANAAGWEPKRFVVIHVTSKSKAPARILGAKGTATWTAAHPLSFDPSVDMDPRLVVSFFDLPRESDISALVLRFGGECELVWLNDKNALAVFNDPARAATAMRRLDHGSAYYGAIAVHQNGGALSPPLVTNAWGGAGVAKDGVTVSSLKGNPWKRAVVQERGWREDSWGPEEWPMETPSSILVEKEAPISTSTNRWSILDSDSSSSSSSSISFVRTDGLINISASHSGSTMETKAITSTLEGGNSSEGGLTEVVDDWEKAYD